MNHARIGLEPLRWDGQTLAVLDQRELPGQTRWIEARDLDAVIDAIRSMAVRGAPAIGIAAAYGAVLAARSRPAFDATAWDHDLDRLAEARPTAVNLRWAIQRMRRVAAVAGADPVAALDAEARAIHAEDLAQNQAMGAAGARFLATASRVLTHCNTGALATGGWGTALGVIRSAWADGRIERVYATETRPWLQGARLTAWELAQDGIPVTLIVDSAAAASLRAVGISWVLVGADRIAANGDVANKIGTYGLALAARAHGAKVMVVAPSGTVDLALADGAAIPIEDRGPDEVWRAVGGAARPDGIEVANPSFDVTPAGLIDVLVTEKGVLERPDRASMARLFGG
jgi:methylthioribose-1-phosphate isomerase